MSKTKLEKQIYERNKIPGKISSGWNSDQYRANYIRIYSGKEPKNNIIRMVLGLFGSVK